MHSENIADLATALARAQGEFKAAAKGRENTFYHSAYADLPAVMEACRAALSKHGLAVIQITQFEGQENWLDTMLVHASGQWIKSRYPVRPVKSDPQGLGSAQTYARRYALMALVGIVADDESDDDGNLASGKGNSGIQPHPETPAPNPKTIATQWANETTDYVVKHPFKNLRELDEWHAPKRDRIASVRGHNEAAHKRLVEAIQKRQADLTPLAVG